MSEDVNQNSTNGTADSTQEAHRIFQKTLAGILENIKNIDSDMTLLFYPDLLQSIKIENNIQETDLLISEHFIDEIKSKYEISTFENGNMYIGLNSGKLKYRVNLFTHESFPNEVADYLAKSKVQSGDFKALKRKASAGFVLFKMLYHYGATDNSLRMLYNLFNPEKNVVSISSDLNYYLSLITENSFKSIELNKFLTDRSFKFIYPLENCVSSRILSVYFGNYYISRVYKLEDRYVKQANHGIAENEYNLLNHLSKYNCFPNVKNLQIKGNSHYFDVEAINGKTISEDENFHLNYSYNEKKEFVVELLDILEILEKEGIEHRDINTNNIFVRDKKPVLFDFGWAKKKGEEVFTPNGLNDHNLTPNGENSDVYAVARTLDAIGITDYDSLISEMMSDWSKPISEYYKTLETNFGIDKQNKTQELNQLAKTKEPLVSIIMPTFNRKDLIRRSIDSVLNQDYKNIELIIVNDFGESIESILDDYRETLKIKYLEHTQNKGNGASRNTGLNVSEGKYIAYLDDDDFYYNNHISTLVNHLENSVTKVAYTDSLQRYEELKNGKLITLFENKTYSKDMIVDELLVNNFIPNLCLMHEKECLIKSGMFDEKLASHVDWDFLIRLALEYKFDHIKHITCVFSTRTDKSNLTSNKEKMLNTLEEIYKKTDSLVSNNELLQRKREEFTSNYKKYINKSNFNKDYLGIEALLKKIVFLIQSGNYSEAINNIHSLQKTYDNQILKHFNLYYFLSVCHYKNKEILLSILNLELELRANDNFVLALEFKKKIQTGLRQHSEQFIIDTKGCEFGYELFLIVPFSNWLIEKGYSHTVTSAMDTKALYFFNDNLKEKYDSRGWVPMTEIENIPFNDLHVNQLDTNYLSFPDFKRKYRNNEFQFEKEILFISNKFNQEWEDKPVNYIDINTLETLFSLYNEKYQIIYNRPPSKLIIDDNSEIYELNDDEILKKYPNIIQFHTLYKKYSDKYSFNEFQLRVMANSDKFISVQGRTSILSSMFGGENIIFAKKGKELECGSYRNWYHKYSNTKIIHVNNYSNLIYETGKLFGKESIKSEFSKDLPQLIKNLKQGNYQEALELSEKLMDNLPRNTINNSNLHYSKALCLFKLGRHEEAAEAVSAEIIINPGFEEAYELQSAIEDAMGGGTDMSYDQTKPEQNNKNIENQDYEVTIIIPCFNKVELTKQCLESIFEITDQNIKYEVLVVDNASEDATEELCLQYSETLPNFRYIKNDENMGFAIACNQGIEERKGKHALLLNNDTVVTEGWLREMLTTLNNEEKCGIVGSCLLFPDSELIQHCGVYMGENQKGLTIPFHCNMFKKLSETPVAKEVRKLKAVTGACFLISKDLIQEVGILDDNYINGFEDIDYCLTAREAGWDIYYCGRSVLYHYESMSQDRHKFDNENAVRFVRKWDGKITPELSYEQTVEHFKQNVEKQKQVNDQLEYDYKQVRREILGKGKDEIEFSIIIPVHSDAQYTKKCLKLLYSQTFLHNIEVIIIDNNSDAQTKQLLSTLGDFAKVIVNEKNESYSKANNQGAEIATGKYLVFMNNDIETKTGWMESLETAFDSNPEIAIQGAKLTYPDNRIQHAGIVWGPVPELNNINLHYHVHLLKEEDDPAVNIAKEFQMVTGALLTIRREVFEQVGGFDERYHFGHEDLDLCMKVLEAGYKVWYNPKVSATHHESITKKTVGMDKFERYFKNEDSYDKANHEYFLSKWQDKLVVDSVTQTTTKQQNINTDSDKKRILFTMYGWNEVGGGTTFPKSVAKGLVLKGYEVYVIYATGKHPHSDEPYFVEESNDSGVNLIGIYNRPAKFLDYERPEREVRDDRIVEIYEDYLEKIDPDIVNFHNFIGLSFGIVKPTTDQAIKTIFTPYNYHPIDPKLYMFTDDLQKWGSTEFFTYSDVPDIDRKHDLYEERINVARDSVNTCDMVLAVSNRQKEIYEEFGIYKEIIYKVNQIHDNLDVITKRESREVSKPIKVGFIGAVIPQKGIQSLIAACSQIDKQDLELHIYGYCDEEYREILQSIRTECEIVFHGAYDKNQLNDIANKLDLMVVPSIWEDCAPFVVQESLAMGLPVIGSDLGGISDFVEDGYNGIIYDHSNSIELRDILLDMIKNPDLLTELQENASVPVSFNDYLMQLTAIYEKLISNAPLKREEIEFDFKSMLKGVELKDNFEEEASVGAKRVVINLNGYSSAGAKNLYNKNAEQSLFNKDTQKIDLDDSSLQSLELENVLEYLETDEVAKLLKESRRVLSGKGKLEISVLDVATISSGLSTGDISLNDYNNMMFGAANHRIKNSFDSASLNALMKTNKFESIEIKKTRDDSTAIGKPLITGIGTKPSSGVEQSANGYTYSKEYRPQLNIVWEGTQFVHHSLALINREQCSNIIDAEVADLTIVPYEPEKFNPKGNDKYEKLYWHDIRVKENEKERLPYVWVRHQWPPKNEPPKGARWIINQPWEFSALTTDLKDAFQNADEIWTPTNWCRNVYINSGIEPDKVQVIPNGIDPSLFTPKGKHYPLKSNKKVKFLFVGGTIYRKGIDVLLDSYVSTFTKHDDVCLVIKDMGGDTFYKGQTAKEYINKLKLIDDTPEIEYIDEMLPEEDIAALYRACDVFVSPYRGEGFSLPTLEAMACGLPVIVTDGGATDDFVDENAGWKIKSEPKSIGNSMGDRTFVQEAFLLEPDHDDLSAKLRHAYDSSTSLISVGLIASHRARTIFTWRNATIKTLKRLDYLYDTEMATPAMLKLEKLEDDYILLGEAETAFNNFDYDTAIQLYKQVVESGNLDDEYEALALKETVLIMLNTGNYDLAEQFLESFNPDDVDYQYLSAKTKAYKGNLEDCLDEMTNIMNNWQKIKHDSQISLTLDHVLSFVGEIMSAMGDDESALKVYQASLEINKLNIDSLFGIGEIMIRSEQYDLGKEYLQQVIAVYPDHQDAIELLNRVRNDIKIDDVNYNNLDDWAIGTELFNWIRNNLPKGSTILEFGSGTGTEELSKFYNMISVEQNEKWVGYVNKPNVNYIHAPINNGWYDTEKVFTGLMDKKYDLILIDGPQGEKYRGGIDRHIHRLENNVPILLDDTNRVKDKNHALNLAKQLNRNYIEIKGDVKNFIVIQPDLQTIGVDS